MAMALGRCSARRLAAVLVALHAIGLARAATRTGGIDGRVILGEKLNTRKIRFSLYPDAHRPPTPEDAPGLRSEMANVVVYVESVAPGEVPPRARPDRPVMRQEHLAFEPHVLPVVKGETVDFLNGDPLYHNVFSLSKAATFDLGRYPSGRAKPVRFDHPGVVKVFCHIHADMSATVLVLDNPFFAVPDGDGRLSIDGLPPGDYRVTAWHERARPVTESVRVEAGRLTPVVFEVPLSGEAPHD